VANQDGAVVKHVQQYGLYITQARPHTTHVLCSDTTEPRVVVHNLVFWSYKRLINCLQIWVDYCHPRQLGTRCCVHLTHTVHTIVHTYHRQCIQLNNSMCAMTKVSQRSVETLLRWGRKHLHHFAANLFRKQHTKFHQNRPGFVGDITQNILVSFFWTQCILYTPRTHNGYRCTHLAWTIYTAVHT